MPTPDELRSAAERLHGHLTRRHYRDGLLWGPDAGVRFNLRAWRFAKSALELLPWHDDYAFMQTQGYWVLANWMLFELTGDARYRRLALEASEATLRLQTPEGFWTYPLPERRHLVATVEGDWGAIALLSSHLREPRNEFLEGAVRWYEFLVTRIGFQKHDRGQAINYFDRPRGKVPNNSVEAAWFFLRLWRATGEERFLERMGELMEFVSSVQLPSGELPYLVEGPYERGRDHYLCFQYNSFQFLKMAWSEAARAGATPASLLKGLAKFLERGVAANGASLVDCSSPRARPETDYYTAALAAALHEAEKRRLTAISGLSERCYARTLARQRADGSFAHSTGDYFFLSDGRSYPRPQAMTLFHLLYPLCGEGFPEGR